MGLRGPKPKRKEVTWSSDIAYAAGLIATDGSLSIDGRHIDLTSKDREQLDNFMRCIGREVTISTKKGRYSNQVYMRLQLSDVTLYEFFVSIGLTPKKSHTIGKIIVPDKYFFDFLRGHHDGDGSFHSYLDPRWKNSFMFYLSFISASRAHVEWIRENITRLAGVQGHFSTAQSSCVVQLRYAKKEAIQILQRMYPTHEVICLSRKRLKIEAALRIVGESLPVT
jgi:hypothetical protein